MSQRAKAVIGLLTAAAIVMMVLAFASGCATGLAAVEKTLPKVATGLQSAAIAEQLVCHRICLAEAEKCRAKGVKDAKQCAGWVKCHSVRVAIEALVRSIEDDLVGIKSKIRAFRAVQEAVRRLKE